MVQWPSCETGELEWSGELYGGIAQLKNLCFAQGRFPVRYTMSPPKRVLDSNGPVACLSQHKAAAYVRMNRTSWPKSVASLLFVFVLPSTLRHQLEHQFGTLKQQDLRDVESCQGRSLKQRIKAIHLEQRLGNICRSPDVGPQHDCQLATGLSPRCWFWFIESYTPWGQDTGIYGFSSPAKISVLAPFCTFILRMN